MKRFLTAAVVASALSQPATAAISGNLVFTNPTGTVSATDSIEVWVTLTLDTFSDPLTYDPSVGFPNGLDPANIPTSAYSYTQDAEVPFASYDYIYTFTSLVCDDTFSDGCGGPNAEYQLDNFFDPREWFDFQGTINPGESHDFLWGVWTPISGPASSGVYQLNYAGLGLGVEGLDDLGVYLDTNIIQFETDCPAANCTFTRTVTAPVPVPAAAWLFGMSLLSLFGVKARRN